MSLPGYDDWLMHNPADDRCEFCGAEPWQCRAGWQPDCCTDECGRKWRDADDENDARRDDRLTGDGQPDEAQEWRDFDPDC